MKTAIPVDESKAASAVCAAFGRAPYFLFCDAKRKSLDDVGNSADAEGGAALKAAPLVVDNGAHALLTVRWEKNAADVLTAVQIKVYKTQAGTQEDNLTAFTERGSL